MDNGARFLETLDIASNSEYEVDVDDLSAIAVAQKDWDAAGAVSSRLC